MQSLLAIATVNSRIFIFGKPGCMYSWEVAGNVRMKFLQFMNNKLLCASKDTIIVYDLSVLEARGPKRDSITSSRSLIT